MTQLELDVAAMGPANTIIWVKANCPKVLSMTTVTNAIKAAIPPAPTYHWMQHDIQAHYVPPGKVTELAACISNCPPASAYQPDYLDCDDYAMAFKGWLAKSGLGTLTVGICSYVCFDAAGITKGKHTLLVCVDSNNKVYLFEPMDGSVRDPANYYWLGAPATCASKQLMFLEF